MPLHVGVVRGPLTFGGFVEHPGERLDLAPVIDLLAVENVLQGFQLHGVGNAVRLRPVVIGLEGAEDVFRGVDEVQHERRVLARQRAVQARERLDGLHPVEPFVHVHRAQQRLVEAGLVFVRHQQHLVIRGAEAPRQRPLGNGRAGHDVRVHPRLRIVEAGVGVAHRTAERDEGPDVRIAVLGQIAIEGQLVAYRVQARRRHHHRLGPAREPGPHPAAEVFDDHLRLLLDVVRVQAHEFRQRPRGFLPGQVRVVRDVLEQAVIRGIRRVVRQHVEDEALFDRLPHTVEVERLRGAARSGPAEDLQGLGLRRGGEGEERQIRLPSTRRHHLVEAVLPILPVVIGLPCVRAQNSLEFARGLAGLAGVRLVHDHGVAARGDLRLPGFRPRGLAGRRGPLRCRARGVQQPAQHEGKLLQRGNDDLGAVDQRFGKLPAVPVDRPDHALRVFDLVDRVLQLPVQHAAVGDDDDAVEDLGVLGVVQTRQPVRQPRDAVGLAAAGRVLDQIVPARPLVARRCGQFPHRVELVIAGKDQGLGTPRRPVRSAAVLLARFDEHEVAEDVEHAVAVQHVFPEIAGPVPRGVARIPRPALDGPGPAAAVEGQEARRVPGQASTHVHLVGVRGEVHQRPRLEPEQRRARVAVLPILAHRVPPRLAGGGVLEFAGRHGQPVQRQQQIHGVASAGVTRDLPRDRQYVPFGERQRRVVPRVGGFEESRPERLAVALEAVAQDVQRALHREFPDQRLDHQILEPRGVQRAHPRPQFRLRRFQERADPRRKQRVLHVPLRDRAALPAAPFEQDRLDVRLEGAFGVRIRHVSGLPLSGYPHSESAQHLEEVREHFFAGHRSPPIPRWIAYCSNVRPCSPVSRYASVYDISPLCVLRTTAAVNRRPRRRCWLS